MHVSTNINIYTIFVVVSNDCTYFNLINSSEMKAFKK